ncbi:hypothetical protein MHU86_22390 [Fragilaria crotonensis]|nr:hypothetical protein MHU86_22390 [Fragilaria crotonensis]
MEERAIENGQISRHQIITILDDFRNGIRDDVREQINAIQQGQARLQEPALHDRTAADGRDVIVRGNRGTLFSYRGRFWDVPATFAFPVGVKRDVGWKLWLQGMPSFAAEGENGVIEQHSIKAFRKFIPARLPKRISNVYKLHWRPVFAMMEEGVGQIPENLKPEIVDNLYERGTEYLQTRVSYIFVNNRLHHNDWVVATWAKYLSRSVILQKGSDADRSNLPAMKLSNRPRPAGLKRRNGAAMAEQIDVAGDQQQRRRRGPHDTINVMSDNDSSEG